MLSEKVTYPAPERIIFSKTGKLKFISHLDLVRTMKAALLRSGVPVWYTEGFNPHPKMVFALPLSLGTESLCEYMDFKITRPMDHDEIAERLNRALPPEIQVSRAYAPKRKFNDTAWASYEITSTEPIDITPLQKKELVVLKKTKSGENETDIAPQIKSAEADGCKAYVILRADNVNFLNPELIAKTLGLNEYSILRTQVYLEDAVTCFE